MRNGQDSMDLTSIIKAVLAPQEERSADTFPSMQPGDRLTGRVLRLESDGRVLIDLGRFRALAHISFGVQPGQTLRLQVLKTGQPLHLQIDSKDLQPTERAIAQLAFAKVIDAANQQHLIKIVDHFLAKTKTVPLPPRQLPEQPPTTVEAGVYQGKGADGGRQTIESITPREQMLQQVRQAMAQIKRLFDPLPMGRPAHQLATWLRSTLENSGAFFEKKLADIIQGRVAAKPATELTQTSGYPQKTENDSRPTDIGQGRVSAKTGTVATQAGEHQQKTEKDSPLANIIQSRVAAKAATELTQAGGRQLKTEDDFQLPHTLAGRSEQPLTSKSEHLTFIRTVLSRDIKPQLLILRDFLAESNSQAGNLADLKPKEVLFLRQTVEQLLIHVEQQQERVSQRAGQPDLFQVLNYLLPVEDQSRPVRLKVYYPKKGRRDKGESHHRIALLLHMDQLGPVRADLAMIQRQLRITFYVRDEAVQKRFEKEIDAVATALTGYFEQIQIDARVSEEKIAQFDREDLSGPSVGRIDIQA